MIRTLIAIALAGLTFAAPALAQQSSNPVVEFFQEFTALNGSMGADMLLMQHVIKAARALVGDYQKQAAELDWWRRYYVGEMAKLHSVQNAGKIKP
jgi:hypothetical protein